MRKTSTLIIGSYLFFLSWDAFFLLYLGIPISVSFIFLSISSLCYIKANKKFELIIQIPYFLNPIILLIVFATLSLIWTNNRLDGFYRIIILWSYLFTAVYINSMVKICKLSIYKLIWCYIIGVLSVGLFSLIQVGFEMRRFSIVGGLNPTWYAAQLVWSIIASYSVYLRSNLLGKIFLLINVVIVIFLLILTQGRNSIMALSTSFFISIIISQLKNIDFKTLVFKRKKHIIIKYIKILVICFFIIGVLSLILMETGVYDNLDRILQTSELISGDRDVATAGRTTIWNNYQHLLLRNFIVGRGVRSSNILYEQLYNVRIPAHNNFITILVEYGSIGLMLIITFHLYSFKLAFGRYEFIFSVCWISLALLFIGLGNDVIYYKYWWTGIIIFILILNIERSNKANSINS